MDFLLHLVVLYCLFCFVFCVALVMATSLFLGDVRMCPYVFYTECASARCTPKRGIPPVCNGAPEGKQAVSTAAMFWTLCAAGNVYTTYIASILFPEYGVNGMAALCRAAPTVWTSRDANGTVVTYTLTETLELLKSNIAWGAPVLAPLAAALASRFFSEARLFRVPCPTLPKPWLKRTPSVKAQAAFVERVYLWYVDRLVYYFLMYVRWFLRGEEPSGMDVPSVPAFLDAPMYTQELLASKCPPYPRYEHEDYMPVVHVIELWDGVKDTVVAKPAPIRLPRFNVAYHPGVLSNITRYTCGVWHHLGLDWWVLPLPEGTVPDYDRIVRKDQFRYITRTELFSGDADSFEFSFKYVYRALQALYVPARTARCVPLTLLDVYDFIPHMFVVRKRQPHDTALPSVWVQESVYVPEKGRRVHNLRAMPCPDGSLVSLRKHSSLWVNRIR